MGIRDKITKFVTDAFVSDSVKRAITDYNSNLYHRSSMSQKDASSGGGASSLVIGLAKRLGLRFGDITSTDYEDPEYDLYEIDSAYDTDSYIRQGVDKYIEQMFKEGYGFYGNNPSAVEYVKLRIEYMSATTQIPFENLIVQMADSLVKYSNCMLAKSRMSDQSQLPPGASVAGIDGMQPVVGYFPIHPATMKAKRDKNGLVKGWQQDIDSNTVNFKSTEIVHIPYKQRIGYLFGTPFLIPVLDDIKALRFLEENCINMVYKNVNPFIHAKVGFGEQAGSSNEVTDVQNELDGMGADGGMVTTNRVEIVTVGTNNAVDAEPYLRYLEERVFSGLGIPAVKFGRGGTANRNTADSMTDEMSDRIKAFQQAVETGVNNFIVRELLIEGGFDPLNNPDDVVRFEYLENDMDRKIKSEAHAVFMYENNAYTEIEMRDAIGREPIGDDRSGMYQMIVTQANMAFEASLQPATTGTSSSSSSSNSSSTTKKASAASNKVKPTNQHGTKTSPKKNTNSKAIELILSNNINELSNELEIGEVVAKTIIHTFKKSINVSRLNNENYTEYMNERIEHLANVFRKKRC